MSLLRMPIPRRLGARLTLFLFVLLSGLAVAVGLVVFSGFRRSEDNTTRLSQEGIINFGTDTVASLAALVAEGSLAQITPYEQTARSAASYVVAARDVSLGDAFPAVTMTREPGKGWFDPDPRRAADVWLPASAVMDDATTAEIRASAVLDLYLPGELEARPSAVAAYFVSVSGLTRYYPPVGLESRLPPDFDSSAQTYGSLAGPDANPDRESVWSPPYNDPAGRGLLVTVTSPVYDDDEFLGIVGVDLSLSRFVASIDGLQPSRNGYAFALASDGSLLPSLSRAVIDDALADPTNLSIGRTLAAMRAGQVGAERLLIDGEEVVVGYAPLSSIGGSIALVVPVADIAEDAGIPAVTGAIAEDGQRTLLFVWLTVGTLFVGALAVAWYLSRRYIAHPIGAIVSGTRAVADGDLSVVIPVRRADEIGDLAASFNDMTSTLSVRAEQLREETAERTRTQQELEAVFAAMSDVVTIVSRDGTYLRVPVQHEDRFAVPFEQIRGRNIRDFFPADIAATFLDAIHAAIDERRTVTTEYQLTGTDSWYSGAVSPLDAETAVIVARDITERVRAQQLLEQRVEERTRELAAVVEGSRNITSRLELEPLLSMLLTQLQELLPHDGSTVAVVQGGDLVFLEARGSEGREQAIIGRRIPPALLGSIWQRYEAGEYVVVDDVLSESADASTIRGVMDAVVPERLAYVRALMLIPLMARDHIVGALTVARTRPGSLTTGDAELVSAFANFAAIAIDNARLFEEAQRRIRQNTALARVGANLRHATSLGEVLDRTCMDVRDAAGALAVSILVGGEQPNVFRAAGAVGLPEGYLPAMVECWRNGAFLVDPADIVAGVPLVNSSAFETMQSDPGFAPMRPFLRSFIFGTVAVLPIEIAGEIRGSLNVYLGPGEAFGGDDLEFLNAIAVQVSIVVTNAHLVEQSAERAQDLEVILTAADRLSTTLEIDPLVDVAFGQLDLIAPHEGEAIYLLDGDDVRAFHRRGSDRAVPPRRFRIPVAESGLLTQRVLGGEAVAVDDVRAGETEGVWTENARALGLSNQGDFVRSLLSVPLVVSGRVIGAIAMISEQPARFTARHRRLAQGIAYQMAVAFENARLFVETTRRANEMAALYQADEALYRSLDVRHVFQALVDVAVEVLEADAAAVIELGAGPAYELVASRGYSPAMASLLAGPGESVSLAATLSGRDIVTVEDIATAQGRDEPFAAEGVAAFANVPIDIDGEVIGVLHLGYRAPHWFSGDETRISVALARRAAVAIQNARLYEQAQQAASLEERQRIARDLHDSVSQALYGIALGARTARSLLDRDPKRLEQPLDYVLSLAEAGLAELRALIFELRPDALKTDGLVAALERQVAATRARHRIEVDAELIPEPSVSIEAKEALYRVAQEGMTNAIKHARATRLGLRLSQQGEALRLEVSDNGVGFDTNGNFPGHMGLKSMRERAQKLGGTVDIVSAPGEGVTIRVELPVGAGAR